MTPFIARIAWGVFVGIIVFLVALVALNFLVVHGVFGASSVNVGSTSLWLGVAAGVVAALAGVPERFNNRLQQ